jgi:drug/metabolite transporter (DMT)-like permease
MSISYWILLFTGIFMSASGGIFLKMGSVELEHNGAWHSLQQALTNWKVLVGLSLYLFPAAIWIFMLKKVDISFLQPMFSLVYVITPILALMVLHENIPLNRWLGIAVIVVGVLIVARG